MWVLPPDRCNAIPATVIVPQFSFALREPFRNKGLRFHCIWMCVDLVIDVLVQWYLFVQSVPKNVNCLKKCNESIKTLHWTEKEGQFLEKMSCLLCIGEIDTLFSMLDYFLECLHKPCTHVLNHTIFRKMCVNMWSNTIVTVSVFCIHVPFQSCVLCHWIMRCEWWTFRSSQNCRWLFMVETLSDSWRRQCRHSGYRQNDFCSLAVINTWGIW